MHNAASPSFDFKENLPLCFLADDEKFSTAKTASMLYANPAVETTMMNVPLAAGIPIKGTNERGDGNTQCFKICEQTLALPEVQRFYKFVKRGYGYRLYLDDLPNATIIDGQTEYGTTVPLGYSKNDDKVHVDFDGILQDINIFNHLDITVNVTKNMAGKAIQNYDGTATIEVDYNGI